MTRATLVLVLVAAVALGALWLLGRRRRAHWWVLRKLVPSRAQESAAGEEYVGRRAERSR